MGRRPGIIGLFIRKAGMKMDRRIDLEGIDNCRQLGGLPGAEGKHIKNGLLLRSANLFGATARDGKVLTGTYRLNSVGGN